MLYRLIVRVTREIMCEFLEVSQCAFNIHLYIVR